MSAIADAVRSFAASHPGASGRDIARACGCSPGMVSLVLSGRSPRNGRSEPVVAGLQQRAEPKFSESELTAGPGPVEERGCQLVGKPTAGPAREVPSEAARRAAELFMTVGRDRIAELLAEFRSAGPAAAAQVCRDASAELGALSRAWRELVRHGPGETMRVETPPRCEAVEFRHS